MVTSAEGEEIHSAKNNYKTSNTSNELITLRVRAEVAQDGRSRRLLLLPASAIP